MGTAGGSTAARSITSCRARCRPKASTRMCSDGRRDLRRRDARARRLDHHGRKGETLMPVDSSRLAAWMAVYRVELDRAVVAHPQDYPWYPATSTTVVADRMEKSFARGSYNISGHAIKATARHFGISPTYKAINAFLLEHA